MPSYSSEGKGLKVDGVTDGRAGQKAGILTGDVIIQMGDHAINDIQNYMDALGKFEKGQTIPVKTKTRRRDPDRIRNFLIQSISFSIEKCFPRWKRDHVVHTSRKHSPNPEGVKLL